MIPADDQLAAVLAEIAEIEGRDGFEGPKIGRRLQLIRISAYADHGDNGEEVFGDRVVGKIGRACDARGWRYDIVTHQMKCRRHVVVVGPGPYSMSRHDTNRALAAANAYLAAIGGDER